MTCSYLLQQNSLNWVGPLILCEAELRRIPPGVAGVYLLQAFVAAVGGYPILYVGQSADLRRRLGEHLGTVRAGRRRPLATTTYFSAAPVLGVGLRHRVEAGLIQMLDPDRNRQVPCAHPVFVNLPPLHVFSQELQPYDA